MTRDDLAKQIASEHGLSVAKSKEIVNDMFNIMFDAVVAGGEVEIRGFGRLHTKDTAARAGVNPSTGAKIQIPASKKLVFKGAKAFKDAIKA